MTRGNLTMPDHSHRAMSMLTQHESTVNSFYLAFFGRPADPAGMTFWAQHLDINGGNLAFITDAFANSEEARVRFGTDSAAERIAEIYQQLFNRATDAVGLAYWTDVLEQGHASMADVAVAIMNGAQGSDARLSALRQGAADALPRRWRNRAASTPATLRSKPRACWCAR